MNVTRNEKLISLLVLTNCVTGFLLYNKVEPQQVENQANRHQLLAQSYSSDTFIRQVNSDLYEYMRPDGMKGIALSDASYVFYGKDIVVDQIFWDQGIPQPNRPVVYSSSPVEITTNKITGATELTNFGSAITPSRATPSQLASSRSVVVEQSKKQKRESTQEQVQKIRGQQSVLSNKTLLPTFNCDLHFCKEGDLPAYPLPKKALSGIYSLIKKDLLPSFEVGKGETIDLAVLWDIDCPKCKSFYSKSLSKLLDDGKRIRFIITTNEDYSQISPSRWEKMTKLLCDENPLSILNKQINHFPYLPQPKESSSCSMSSVKAQVKALKNTLKKYGLNGPTPVTFTQKGMLYGAIFDYEQTNRYLN